MATNFDKMTVAQLQVVLKEAGLPSSGKKADLIKRVSTISVTSDAGLIRQETSESISSVGLEKISPKRAASGPPSAANKKAKTLSKSASTASVRSTGSASQKDYGEVCVSDQPYGPATDGRFKIASWNVNGLRSVLKVKEGDTEPAFERYLRQESADVVCVQETKLQEKNTGSLDAKSLAADLYPYRYFASSTAKLGYAGTAIFCKTKPLAVTYGIGSSALDQEGRCITAEFERFYIVTTYTPNAGQKLERLDYRTKQWDVEFLAYLQQLDSLKPVVWTGDLNVAHTEIDIAEPKQNKRSAGFTPQERESFSNILAQNFKDSFRELNPGKERCYTWWSVRHNCKAINKGWRLDMYIVSERLMSLVEDSFIRGDVEGSDHCPIGLLIKPSDITG